MRKIFQFTYIRITIFQSRQQKSTTYAIIDWKEKQSRTQGENQLIKNFFVKDLLYPVLNVPIRNAETILPLRKLLKYHLFDLSFTPSSSVVRHLVDKPALASIMAHDHDNDFCVFELGRLKI